MVTLTCFLLLPWGDRSRIFRKLGQACVISEEQRNIVPERNSVPCKGALFVLLCAVAGWAWDVFHPQSYSLYTSLETPNRPHGSKMVPQLTPPVLGGNGQVD